MLEELFSPDPQILNFEEVEFDADVFGISRGTAI
jgi:hypothetical protein